MRSIANNSCRVTGCYPTKNTFQHKLSWNNIKLEETISTLKAPFTTIVAVVANVDQDQAAQKRAAWSLIYTVHSWKTLYKKAAIID